MKVLTILDTGLKGYNPWHKNIKKTIIKKDGVSIELTGDEVKELLKNIGLPPTANFLFR
jgi:hypothetical protein